MKRIWTVAIMMVLGSLLSCGQQSQGGASRPVLFVSIQPQKYFVEKIAGDRYDVGVMVRPGYSPATYEPLPRQLKRLSRAALYFRIHVPFEKAWLPKVRNMFPELTVVDTRSGITPRVMDSSVSVSAEKQHEEHSHKHDTDHAHESHHDENAHDDHDHGKGKDPHIWLSPKLVKVQAENIANALISHDPAHADTYRKNLAAFKRELDDLHQRIQQEIKKLPNRTLLVFHPAWGYFADEFNLRQVPIEVEGKRPTAKQLGAVIDYAKKHKIRVVFVQKQFSTKEAKTVADAIDGRVCRIDPLAADYRKNMLRIARTISSVLSKGQ